SVAVPDPRRDFTKYFRPKILIRNLNVSAWRYSNPLWGLPSEVGRSWRSTAARKNLRSVLTQSTGSRMPRSFYEETILCDNHLHPARHPMHSIARSVPASSNKFTPRFILQMRRLLVCPHELHRFSPGEKGPD